MSKKYKITDPLNKVAKPKKSSLKNQRFLYIVPMVCISVSCNTASAIALLRGGFQLGFTFVLINVASILLIFLMAHIITWYRPDHFDGGKAARKRRTYNKPPEVINLTTAKNKNPNSLPEDVFVEDLVLINEDDNQLFRKRNTNSLCIPKKVHYLKHSLDKTNNFNQTNVILDHNIYFFSSN